MTLRGQWPAAPVYTPHDYPLILKLSKTDDLPATWEEWWEDFKASEAEQRRQGLLATRVRVHAGKFKAWLQANALASSESTRRQYAQQRLDWKRARRVAQRAAERLPWAERMQLFAPPPALPSPWPHRAIEVLAYVILAVAVGSLLIALLDGWPAWVMRELPDWPIP